MNSTSNPWYEVCWKKPSYANRLIGAHRTHHVIRYRLQQPGGNQTLYHGTDAVMAERAYRRAVAEGLQDSILD